MSDQVTLTIDGVEVTVPKGTLIVEAAKQIENEIPVFCYHAKMEPVGMCRMCLVEVGTPAVNRATREPELDEEGNPVIRFFPKPMTACTTPVSDGMVVKVNSEALVEMALADSTLGKFCQQIGKTTLVIPAGKEKSFRERLKELEYVLLEK